MKNKAVRLRGVPRDGQTPPPKLMEYVPKSENEMRNEEAV